jgi:hypothetical protein
VALNNAEDYATNTVLRQVASNLPQTTAKRPIQRHTNGPTVFNRSDILTKDTPVGNGQRFEPNPHGLHSAVTAVEQYGKALHLQREIGCTV